MQNMLLRDFVGLQLLQRKDQLTKDVEHLVLEIFSMLVPRRNATIQTITATEDAEVERQRGVRMGLATFEAVTGNFVGHVVMEFGALNTGWILTRVVMVLKQTWYHGKETKIARKFTAVGAEWA